jgi:hypothetical protein
VVVAAVVVVPVVVVVVAAVVVVEAAVVVVVVPPPLVRLIVVIDSAGSVRGPDPSKVPTYAAFSVELVRYTSDAVGEKAPSESDKLILLLEVLITTMLNLLLSGLRKADILRLLESVEAPTRCHPWSVNAE